MSVLQIRLFGTVELSFSELLSPLKLTRATQELLAYLLLNTGKMCRRETVMDHFWPDQNTERARSCLNSAVWRLRRELQANGLQQSDYILTSDSGEIGFNWESDYWLDVQAFEQKLLPILRKPVTAIETDEAEGVANALAFYRGDLVDGIYEDWTLIERERFREMYVNGLAHLMSYYWTGGFYPKSLEFGKAILEKDPIREDIHRKIMRLYLLTGQRALAVKQYQICRAILKNELDIGPMEETEQLHRTIMELSSAQVTAQVSSVVDATTAADNFADGFHLVMQNLEVAHSHLKKAALLIAKFMPADHDLYAEEHLNNSTSQAPKL